MTKRPVEMPIEELQQWCADLRACAVRLRFQEPVSDARDWILGEIGHKVLLTEQRISARVAPPIRAAGGGRPVLRYLRVDI